jgi:hypothetical protein
MHKLEPRPKAWLLSLLRAASKHIKVTLGNRGLGWFLTIHQGSALTCTQEEVLSGIVNVREHILVWLVGISLTRNLHALVSVATLKAFDQLLAARINEKHGLALNHLGKLRTHCLKAQINGV